MSLQEPHSCESSTTCCRDPIRPCPPAPPALRAPAYLEHVAQELLVVGGVAEQAVSGGAGALQVVAARQHGGAPSGDLVGGVVPLLGEQRLRQLLQHADLLLLRLERLLERLVLLHQRVDARHRVLRRRRRRGTSINVSYNNKKLTKVK